MRSSVNPHHQIGTWSITLWQANVLYAVFVQGQLAHVYADWWRHYTTRSSYWFCNTRLKPGMLKIQWSFWIGENFSTEELQQRLYANAKQPLLLYPNTPEGKSLGLLIPAPLPELKQLLPEQLRLVVIDATWRKSRKMLYINQALQQLPRFALIKPPTTIYKIRKADSENQLSTLEASCYALQQLEPGSDYQPLLQAFRQFIDQFASYLPTSSLNQSHIEELWPIPLLNLFAAKPWIHSN